MRFEHLKGRKSDNWSNESLKTTLKSLKSNKTRDPSGLINELFKPPVIVKDLEDAVLSLVNGIKSEYFIPYNLQMSNITTTKRIKAQFRK